MEIPTVFGAIYFRFAEDGGELAHFCEKVVVIGEGRSVA